MGCWGLLKPTGEPRASTTHPEARKTLVEFPPTGLTCNMQEVRGSSPRPLSAFSSESTPATCLLHFTAFGPGDDPTPEDNRINMQLHVIDGNHF